MNGDCGDLLDQAVFLDTGSFALIFPIFYYDMRFLLYTIHLIITSCQVGLTHF